MPVQQPARALAMLCHAVPCSDAGAGAEQWQLLHAAPCIGEGLFQGGGCCAFEPPLDWNLSHGACWVCCFGDDLAQSWRLAVREPVTYHAFVCCWLSCWAQQ